MMQEYILTLVFNKEVIRIPIFSDNNETARQKAIRAMRIFPKSKLLCYHLQLIEESNLRGVAV